MPFFSPTAQFANENNEGNKAQIQTLRENIFFFSQHFQGQDDNVYTFAAARFIGQLGCCTKIATELETYLSLTLFFCSSQH